MSTDQQATQTEPSPVYLQLNFFWIKICILPRYCKKRFIFTSCYRAAVKQMTRRKWDFSSIELKGVWAEEGGEEIRVPVWKPKFLSELWDKTRLTRKHSSSWNLKCQGNSKNTSYTSEEWESKGKQQKEWQKLNSREVHLLLQQLLSLQFQTEKFGQCMWLINTPEKGSV